MELPEQTELSAEGDLRLKIINRLEDEYVQAGSFLQHLVDLGIWYEKHGDHKVNLYLLQRMANMITNPANDLSVPKELTEAFYWGEVLAYRAQDLMSGGDEQSETNDWAEVAYPLYSTAMFNQRRKAKNALIEQGGGLSYEEERQGIANILMEDLGDETSKLMPPAMEQLIIELSEDLLLRDENGKEITDDDIDEDDKAKLAEVKLAREKRWYIILGFRHITRPVVELSLDVETRREIALIEKEKQREADQEEIRKKIAEEALKKEFLEFMAHAEAEDIKEKLVPINGVRQRIMKSYSQHLKTYGSFDINDKDEVERVNTFLTQTMNQDFIDLKEMDLDDFIQIGGSAVYHVEDSTEEKAKNWILEKGEFFKGTPDAVVILQTPAQRTMDRVRKGLDPTTALNRNENPLGVALLLKDAVYVDQNGFHIQVDQHQTVCVILTNPHMTIAKYRL